MTHGFPIFKLEIKYATIIWSLSAFGNWNACNQKNERRRCLQRDGLHSALMVLFSALIFLKLSGLISRNQKAFNLAEKFSPFSFFLFAVHMPFLLACVQNLWLRFCRWKIPRSACLNTLERTLWLLRSELSPALYCGKFVLCCSEF